MSAAMLNHNRRFIRPNKRKEREGFDAQKLSTTKLVKPNVSRVGSPSIPKDSEPASSSGNQLLAGYLAHEFLSKGTLFGQPWDPSRAEAIPVSADFRKLKSSQNQKAKAEPEVEKHQRYVEVADLLKRDGAHLPGVINPTQLGRFLQM